MGWDGANKKLSNEGGKFKNYWTSGGSGKTLVPKSKSKSKKEEGNIPSYKK